MMKITGKIADVSLNAISGKPKVTFEVNEKEALMAGYDELWEKERLSIEVKPWRKKRSLDANAYCWVLIDRLAEVLGTSKEEVYRNAVKGIGGNCDTVCVVNAALESVCKAWARHGLGWQTETFESKIDGCTNVILYYGSSTYDTSQMARMIDNIVQDCKAAGVETMTPLELAGLVERWGNNG